MIFYKTRVLGRAKCYQTFSTRLLHSPPQQRLSVHRRACCCEETACETRLHSFTGRRSTGLQVQDKMCENRQVVFHVRKTLSVKKNIMMSEINLHQTSRLDLDKFGIGNNIPDCRSALLHNL